VTSPGTSYVSSRELKDALPTELRRRETLTTVISGGATMSTITGLYPYEMEVNKPKDAE